jgi:dTDP-4-dehydrorhamnose reductase
LARTLLVLGGTGFLGVHVVLQAVAQGWSVFAAGRNVPILAGVAPEARRVESDLLLPDRARELVESVRPDALVNCAALSRVADCEREPDRARRANAWLAGEVAAACAAAGVRCVQVSTDLVFGARRAPPGGFREDEAVAPVSVYGRTKADGESAVLTAHAGALVVRLPLLFGDSFGRALGASDSVRAAVARGERPMLFTDEWRTPLDVADAAGALVELACSSHATVLHVAGPERWNRCELARIALNVGVGDAAPIRASLRSDAGLGDRPEDVSLDSSRARRVLRTRLRSPREALLGRVQ